MFCVPYVVEDYLPHVASVCSPGKYGGGLRHRKRQSHPTHEAQSVELLRRLYITSVLAQLVQRRLRWLGHAARRTDEKLIKDLLLLTPPSTWRR